MQPDITAPGVNILAAWSPVEIVAGQSLDYMIISGTSMSCPHVSGAAAVVRSHHRSWSPAAIMSALMTTGLFSKFIEMINSQKSINLYIFLVKNKTVREKETRSKYGQTCGW